MTERILTPSGTMHERCEAERARLERELEETRQKFDEARRRWAAEVDRLAQRAGAKETGRG